MSNSSLERIYPDSKDRAAIGGSETLQLHLERYHYAGSRLLPGLVGDIACGAGYGSHLLATQYGNAVNKIIAIDNTPQAIEYARERYQHPLIQFVLTDAFRYQSPDSFNTIISLETIEHLADPQGFVKHLSSQLARCGRLIASAPITPSMDANPYHLHDFTARSFKQLFINAGLTEVDSLLQRQPYKPLQLVKNKTGRTIDLRRNLAAWYLTHPNKLLLRVGSVIKDGFVNKYLVVVFEKR